MPQMGMQPQMMQQPVMQQNMGQALVGQRFRGTVKSYSESNGYGFIGGDEVLAALGKDVFVHQREVTEVTGIARPQVPSGVVVTFAVTINPKGQPQARELRFEDSSFLQMQQMGQSLGMNTGGTGQQGGGLVYVQNGARFKGFVRSFSQVNGFGFVGGDEITQTFGKDVFLHFRELQQIMGGIQKPTIPSGTWVTFTVTMNQKGQPQARDVQFEPTQAGAPYDPSSATMGATAAVAALNLQNPHGGQVGMGAFAPQNQGVTVSDADAYARVQADIERFQRQVEEQRAQKERDAKGGGEDEGDLKRSRASDRQTTTDTAENQQDSRARSRSPRRD